MDISKDHPCKFSLCDSQTGKKTFAVHAYLSLNETNISRLKNQINKICEAEFLLYFSSIVISSRLLVKATCHMDI